MSKLLNSLALAMTLLLAGLGGATAQTATTTTPSSDSALPLGEPVQPAEPGKAPLEPYVREQFGDWVMRCVHTESGKDPCQLYQLMKDDKGNSVAEISLFELPAGGPAEAGATVATPLETLLTEQLTLSVDGGTAKRYPFSYCSTKGCFARIGLTSEDVALLKRGKTASLTIVPVAAPNKKVALTMSLKGFTKGYEAVRANNEAIAAK